MESKGRLIGVEVKSGATVASDFLDGLTGFREHAREASPHLEIVARLIYGGSLRQDRTDATVVPWSKIQGEEW